MSHLKVTTYNRTRQKMTTETIIQSKWVENEKNDKKKL